MLMIKGMIRSFLELTITEVLTSLRDLNKKYMHIGNRQVVIRTCPNIMDISTEEK